MSAKFVLSLVTIPSTSKHKTSNLLAYPTNASLDPVPGLGRVPLVSVTHMQRRVTCRDLPDLFLFTDLPLADHNLALHSAIMSKDKVSPMWFDHCRMRLCLKLLLGRQTFLYDCILVMPSLAGISICNLVCLTF